MRRIIGLLVVVFRCFGRVFVEVVLIVALFCSFSVVVDFEGTFGDFVDVVAVAFLLAGFSLKTFLLGAFLILVAVGFAEVVVE